MEVKCVQVGLLQTNCYMVCDGDSCLLVDPGEQPDRILAMLGGRKPDVIVLTHRHMDHIGALPAVVEATGSPVAAGAGEAPAILAPGEFDMHLNPAYVPVPKIDIELRDGDVLEAGSLRFDVIETPGHTEGGICLYNAEGGLLFSGDTLFAGTCGRTDFPGGDPVAMRASLKRLAELPPETQVLPGHDSFSTIANETGWISRL